MASWAGAIELGPCFSVQHCKCIIYLPQFWQPRWQAWQSRLTLLDSSSKSVLSLIILNITTFHSTNIPEALYNISSQSNIDNMHTVGFVSLIMLVSSIISLAAWATVAAVSYNWASEHSGVRRDVQQPTISPGPATAHVPGDTCSLCSGPGDDHCITYPCSWPTIATGPRDKRAEANVLTASATPSPELAVPKMLQKVPELNLLSPTRASTICFLSSSYCLTTTRTYPAYGRCPEAAPKTRMSDE